MNKIQRLREFLGNVPHSKDREGRWQSEMESCGSLFFYATPMMLNSQKDSVFFCLSHRKSMFACHYVIHEQIVHSLLHTSRTP